MESNKLRLEPGLRFLLLITIVHVAFVVTGNNMHKKKEIFLRFNELAEVWDEAIPLGNGMLGCLVWEKEGKLRFSLDRADLWDLRPNPEYSYDNWNYQKVYEFWKNDEYQKVVDGFDKLYELPAPSKIPAGAIEFDVLHLGKVKSVTLDIDEAACRVEWEKGAVLSVFVHANKAVGWYKFENIDDDIEVELISPSYAPKENVQKTSQSKNELSQLGYEQGKIVKDGTSFTYNQKAWGDLTYQIHTSGKRTNKQLTGCWSISVENQNWEPMNTATEIVKEELLLGYSKAELEHKGWWSNYWAKSSVSIPDSLLQKQYNLEMYKLGCVARADAPPISLQAVWTADNDLLPPWKGDFHHDLNTQLSYWPSYTGNHLDLETGFVDWLWKYRERFKNYTKGYFGVDGLNVPGVTTLEGEAMGGWNQYSRSVTTGAWLGHHFYMHWKYTSDKDFLKERAYPWLKDVAIFFENISVEREGKKNLLISSSPEIYNNEKRAWFADVTNFDLALIRWTFEKTAELARAQNLEKEAQRWEGELEKWPQLAIDTQTGFMFAPGFPYNESHRHFSHLMAFHPLGMVDYSNGEDDRLIINNTIKALEKHGSDYWVGYSFSWMANLYARNFQGEKAAQQLRKFAECFCLKNSFHVNGDQCKAGHSKFIYRPFTLEGNFAFAAGVQEMLLQSHTGVVNLFPAIPADWKNISFESLRTYGAFLVSAKMENGKVVEVEIESESGGKLYLENPFQKNIKGNKVFNSNDGVLEIALEVGEKIVLRGI